MSEVDDWVPVPAEVDDWQRVHAQPSGDPNSQGNIIKSSAQGGAGSLGDTREALISQLPEQFQGYARSALRHLPLLGQAITHSPTTQQIADTTGHGQTTPTDPLLRAEQGGLTGVLSPTSYAMGGGGVVPKAIMAASAGAGGAVGQDVAGYPGALIGGALGGVAGGGVGNVGASMLKRAEAGATPGPIPPQALPHGSGPPPGNPFAAPYQLKSAPPVVRGEGGKFQSNPNAGSPQLAPGAPLAPPSANPWEGGPLGQPPTPQPQVPLPATPAAPPMSAPMGHSFWHMGPVAAAGAYAGHKVGGFPGMIIGANMGAAASPYVGGLLNRLPVGNAVRGGIIGGQQ